jgi:putative transposase
MSGQKAKSKTAASTPPRNPGLLKLVEAKRHWHYQPDASDAKRGFLGWHERGYLPHFDAPHVTQFVTFMLHDSFPVKRRQEWEGILKEPDESLRRRRLEAWLDRGYGECRLRQPAVASQVEDILHADHGKACHLQAWVVIPNHIHLVVDVWDVPLSKLLNLWKGRSARAANQVLHRRGHFWEREYFDTLIRDAAHLARAIRYIENNPTKAGLAREPKNWPWSSARGRDEFGRLPDCPHFCRLKAAFRMRLERRLQAPEPCASRLSLRVC